jgi:Tfp pilus assembly protein PilX
MGKKGSVLLHVLMTGVVIALVAATLLRLTMLRYEVTAHATQTTAERRYDEAALAMLLTQWNAGNVYCANVASGGVTYSCSGGAAGYAAPLSNCACTCTTVSANYPPTVTGSGSTPNCKLSMTSDVDPLNRLPQ